VWADVNGTARLNAPGGALPGVFMFAAGVIGSYGVIDNNSILIVGAMAVSPDLLPITAVGVGIVARRLGFAAGPSDACSGTRSRSLRRGLVRVPPGSARPDPVRLQHRRDRGAGEPDDRQNETIAVAFVAGIAGMLALETRASAGVGVRSR
jgi:hypothetical protein